MSRDRSFRLSFRLRTIRGWLRAGFGATLALLALGGGVSLAALRAANVRNGAALGAVREQYDTVQQIVTAVLREVVAGTRWSTRAPPRTRSASTARWTRRTRSAAAPSPCRA